MGIYVHQDIFVLHSFQLQCILVHLPVSFQDMQDHKYQNAVQCELKTAQTGVISEVTSQCFYCSVSAKHIAEKAVQIHHKKRQGSFVLLCSED